MSDIEELIRHKFEARMGCKPRMRFKTTDGTVLANEVTLQELPHDRNKLKLFKLTDKLLSLSYQNVK